MVLYSHGSPPYGAHRKDTLIGVFFRFNDCFGLCVMVKMLAENVLLLGITGNVMVPKSRIAWDRMKRWDCQNYF